MKTLSIAIAAVAAIALMMVACDKSEKTATKATPESNATPVEKKDTKHAEVGAVPGSYEDWCEEHQVPESQCTQCNPDLIPAFKATNDWCDEHGLPESQCLKCNPEIKIVRPAKKGP